MKIEIDETDFKGINDKLGKIRSAAVMARMTTEEEMIEHLKNIVTWAQEITVRLNNGILTQDPSVEKENKELLILVAEGAKIITNLQTEIQRLESEGQNENN
jgi:hypothetical protein